MPGTPGPAASLLAAVLALGLPARLAAQTARAVLTLPVTSDLGADGVEIPGDASELTLTFDAAVAVSGTPRLALTIGAAIRRRTTRAAAPSDTPYR